MRYVKAKKIIKDKDGIIGFLISSNLDATLDLYFYDLAYNHAKNKIVAEYGEIEILPKITVPYVIVKSDDMKITTKEIFDDGLKTIKKWILKSKEYSNDVLNLQKDILEVSDSIIDDMLCTTNDLFLCYSVCQDVFLFVGNPFMVIADREQLLQRKSYKPLYGMKLSNLKKVQKIYLDNLENLQNKLNDILKSDFCLFANKVNNKDLLVGGWKENYDIGYSLLCGTTLDSDYCKKHEFSPYIIINEENSSNTGEYVGIQKFFNNLKCKILKNKTK